jgi:hypothetical protein
MIKRIIQYKLKNINLINNSIINLIGSLLVKISYLYNLEANINNLLIKNENTLISSAGDAICL